MLHPLLCFVSFVWNPDLSAKMICHHFWGIFFGTRQTISLFNTLRCIIRNTCATKCIDCKRKKSWILHLLHYIILELKSYYTCNIISICYLWHNEWFRDMPPCATHLFSRQGHSFNASHFISLRWCLWLLNFFIENVFILFCVFHATRQSIKTRAHKRERTPFEQNIWIIYAMKWCSRIT